MNSTIQLNFITLYLEDGTQWNKYRLQDSNQGQFRDVVCVPDHWSWSPPPTPVLVSDLV